MSKTDKNLKHKVPVMSGNKNDMEKEGETSLKLGRKRTRSNRSNPTMAVEDVEVNANVKVSKKAGAKCRIDFRKKQVKTNVNSMCTDGKTNDRNDQKNYPKVDQFNNNSTKIDENYKRVSASSKPMKEVNIDNPKLSRVQWTKEFMDKVRKSNEKAALAGQDKAKNPKLILQEEEAIVQTDGICMQIENEMDDILDYEDDLSIDKEEIAEETVETSEPGSPRPGTSFEVQKQCKQNQDKNADINTDFVLQLKNQPEEKLMGNPVIQRMMQKFFREEFQNMQKQQNNSGTVKNGTDIKIIKRTVEAKNNGKELKSPSDTTIYACALQRKLTPTNQAVYNVVNSLTEPVNETLTKTNDLKVDKLSHQHMVQQLNDENLISDFVESMRLNLHPEDDRNQRRSDVAAVELEDSQNRAEQAIVHAEKFRAAVEPPSGMQCNQLSQPNVFHGVSHQQTPIEFEQYIAQRHVTADNNSKINGDF